jgi:ABC-type transport system substrate-binding protein
VSIVAREVLDQQPDLKGPPVIGTGAWIFEEAELTDHFFARRNPDYFLKGLPYADRFESYRTTDASRMLNAFRTGTVNVVGSGMYGQTGEELLRSVPGAHVFWIVLYNNPSEIWLNSRIEPFGDVRVRQAISKAIDRKAIIDSVLLGHGTLSPTLIMPSPDFRLPDSELVRLFARDVEGARRLLREAGKEGGFEFEALTANYLQGAYIPMAELIQANLRELGINMKITVVDGATLVQRSTSRNFQATIRANSEGGTTNAILYNRYYTNAAQNYAGYADPELNQLIDRQAVMSRDPDGRKRVLQEIQRKTIAEAIYINLNDFENPNMALPDVRGFYPPLGLNSHTTFWATIWFDR